MEPWTRGASGTTTDLTDPAEPADGRLRHAVSPLDLNPTTPGDSPTVEDVGRVGLGFECLHTVVVAAEEVGLLSVAEP